MIKIIFEDDYLLIADKPPGLVVTSSETQTEPTLEDILKNDLQIKAERGGIVHRLDKDTSGIVIVGKSNDTVTKLQDQFKSREVKKEYLTLVHGLVEKEGKIETFIGRNPRDREKFVVFEKAVNGVGEELNVRPAVTEYQPIEQVQMSDSCLVEIFPDYSKIQLKKLYAIRYTLFTLLKCHPLTGRTHQIRVHMKYIGHPIVGDEKYGGRKTSRLDKRWCPRQFLHATKLTFTHPMSGKQLSFESPLPEDLKRVIEVLGEVREQGVT